MKHRFMIGVLVVLALFTVGLSAQVVLAQTGSGTPEATGTAAIGAATTVSTAKTFSVAAGQSVTLSATFWCLDFGKPFPASVTGPKGLAPDKVLNVLAAAQQQANAKVDPYQVQLAVWYATDGTWHDQANAGHAGAQQLVDAAANLNASASANQVLGKLIDNGDLKVTVNTLTAVPDETNSPNSPYHGTGSVVVQNTGNQDVTFVLDGSVFQPADANAQTLVAQATEPTAAATATAVSTATAVVSAQQATETPTPTVAPTETVAPTATVAPTSTAVVTAQTVATTTATVEASATPATLPTTGAGDANGWMYVLLVLGALTLFAGFGLGVRRASK
jgi:hypothetical protein